MQNKDVDGRDKPGRRQRIGLGLGLGGRRRGRGLTLAALNQLVIVVAHGLATFRARRMHGIALQRRDEGTDILHADRVEPAPRYATADGEEIGLGLVRPLPLVPAFMGVDIELHRGSEAVNLLGVEDDEAREGAAPTIEVGIDHGRARAAIH